MRFADRVDAGRTLATRLAHLQGQPVTVLGLPRGGVPVAAQVADALGAPLDVILVRKLGVPFQPELAMGAIGEDGVRVLDTDLVRRARLSERDLALVEAGERAELERRGNLFRRGRPRLDLTGRVAVIVDDGIATGSTARAACEVARAHGATRVVLAVPVAPRDWTTRMAGSADELIAFATPEPFWAIGPFYDDFSQTTDDEVMRCLDRFASTHEVRHQDVMIPSGDVRLPGRLSLPAGARAVVGFAHGSGSSRHSPRNAFVATTLNQAGLGTLLFDLLTEAEERDRANVFDITLLASRLLDATRWLRANGETAGHTVGYFGASTGAAAALWAAADSETDIGAVVSRGGRPDLALPRLASVQAPTLLIVGSEDHVVLDLNRDAQARLRCESRLAVVRGATHLFDEPGTLRAAAYLARDWFVRHLITPSQAAAS